MEALIKIINAQTKALVVTSEALRDALQSPEYRNRTEAISARDDLATAINLPKLADAISYIEDLIEDERK